LFFGATGVFTEMQDSINFIWSVRAKPRRGLVKIALDRLLSFSLIIGFGFVLMVSLAVHALVDLLYDKLRGSFSEVAVVVFQVVNYVILFIVISAMFTVIFRILPDAKIRWRDALVGAMFTAVLFLIGKSLISLYLTKSDVDITFGAAASVVIILVWVYYSSIILYFGAEFTKVYAMNFGGGIVPEKTAVFIIKQEVTELAPTRDEVAMMEEKQKESK
jgi:membrane protein